MWLFKSSVDLPTRSYGFSSRKRSIRLLTLDAEEGSVACRIHSPKLHGTIPRFANHYVLECATRSFLRMRNLKAVRGIRGASMIGPADYFGNLEELHRFLFTINMSGGASPLVTESGGRPRPLVTRYPIPEPLHDAQALKPFEQKFATCLKARWYSGKDKECIAQKRIEYQNHHTKFGLSLTPDTGVLEFEVPHIVLKAFDARGVDLSSFRARLVRLDVPFQITSEKLPTGDEFRMVSYFYESGYANHQIENGSGLFLETHDFAQIITPLDKHAHGFVALGRKVRNGIDLIGIEIPFGWCLIIEANGIHGDATLVGGFLMAMTSNHVTMSTADTVFLHHRQTKQRVRMTLESSRMPSSKRRAAQPIVLFNDATEAERQEFQRNTANESLIFNPFSRGYWRAS